MRVRSVDCSCDSLINIAAEKGQPRPLAQWPGTKKVRNPECGNKRTRARARARLRRCDTFDARLSNKLSTLWHSRRNRMSMVYDRCREEAPDERTDMLDMVRDIRHKHATSSFTHFAPISVENLEIPLKGNRRYVSLFARHSRLH